MILPDFKSLRGRYTIVAGLVAIIVLAGASLGYQQLDTAREEITYNIETRNQLLERSRMVRNAVWQIRESLAAFLLEPDLIEQRNNIQKFLTDARLQTEILIEHSWVKQHRNSTHVLKNTLAELEQAIDTLIQTQLGIARQYPALTAAHANMRPTHNSFYSSADRAINKILKEPRTADNLLNYQVFMQARHIWTQMISSFRMYLANRLGSFDESVLTLQEQDVIIQHQELQKLLILLQKRNDTQLLETQSSAALKTLKTASENWITAFKNIQNTQHTDDWRVNAQLHRSTIKPRMEAIWNMLLELDMRIEATANNDLTTVTHVAERQTQMLWIFTALCLVMIMIGFFALERMILRPVASVARALKTESENMGGATLSNFGTHETQHLVDAFNTMRQQVQARQTALEYHALHDSLTKLGNRNRLTDRLKQAISTAEQDNSTLALLVLDLNHFKEINDTLGHPAGDQLLIEVGLRLSSLLRDTDTIVRLGGDEFAILLPTAHEPHAVQVAEKIALELTRPFALDGQQLYTSASVGITIYPQHGIDDRTLIQRADIAMYQAKHHKANLAIYDAEQDQHSLERLGLMADLRQAIKQNKLQLFFQPQANFSNGIVIGMEALLRWNHPKHGYIPPEEIIQLAEQTGLIHDIAQWVLTHAIQQTKSWMDAGFKLTVAVNLSAHNLADDRIVEHVRALLASNQLPAKQLILEVTENAMMVNPERAVDILTQLNEMGVSISIDDYGTGFSSLSYLKRLPVHELKIDKSFILEMSKNDNDTVIVRSTIDLAHNLGLKVVAEGVEDEDTWDLLQTLHCDIAQGYFLEKPMPSEVFLEWVQRRHSPQLLPNTTDHVAP